MPPRIWSRLRARWQAAEPLQPMLASKPQGHDGPVTPPQQIGGYALLRTFSRGVLGELHLAIARDSGAPLALKTVHFDRTELPFERFLRESRLARQLNHPHIVRTLDAGLEGDGRHGMGWLVMDWVAGGDLSRYSQREMLLPEALVVELGEQIASALAHAHDAGLVHGNLKPSNLLFELAQRSVKVADFGGIHLTDGERTRCDIAIGAPRYLAPEQVVGLPVDGRCDLYALGVVLHELLTGVTLFQSGTCGETLSAVVNDRPADIRAHRPELPRELADLLHRLLGKTPSERPADGYALARELRQIAPLCR